MRRFSLSRIVLIASVALPFLLASCGSTKTSSFYTLNPVLAPPSATTGESISQSNSRPCIGIVSVEVPDYLDRPQIVTRNANNVIEIAEFDRWAGDLRNDIGRVLAETMSANLPGHDIFVLTGRRAVPAEYRVTVNVTRFDPMPDNEVWLKALWTVLGKEGRDIAIRGESNFKEPVQGTGYGATVAAMSRAVDRLGVQISDAIKPVLAKAASSRQTQGIFYSNSEEKD